MKVVIVQKKQRGKTNSFFYEGEIAHAKNNKGTIYSLIATGDIRIDINDDSYRNESVHEAIDKYKLTDKKLLKLEEQGKLTWQNNNWFEVTWLPKGEKVWQFDVGEVVWDYDSAIQLLKDYTRGEQHESERFDFGVERTEP
jgi:hypothetical protein